MIVASPFLRQLNTNLTEFYQLFFPWHWFLDVFYAKNSYLFCVSHVSLFVSCVLYTFMCAISIWFLRFSFKWIVIITIRSYFILLFYYNHRSTASFYWNRKRTHKEIHCKNWKIGVRCGAHISIAHWEWGAGATEKFMKISDQNCKGDNFRRLSFEM